MSSWRGKFWSKKFDRPDLTFLSVIIPHQMRPPDLKSESVLKTPPRAVNPLLVSPCKPQHRLKLLVDSKCTVLLVRTSTISSSAHTPARLFKKLKVQFSYKPRHLRRTWDLGSRVFDETNLNLPCICIFVLTLHIWKIILKKEIKSCSHKNIYTADIDWTRQELSVRYLGFVVYSPSGLFGNCVCVRLHRQQFSCK